MVGPKQPQETQRPVREGDLHTIMVGKKQQKPPQPVREGDLHTIMVGKSSDVKVVLLEKPARAGDARAHRVIARV